jgi:hypothetical protein
MCVCMNGVHQARRTRGRARAGCASCMRTPTRAPQQLRRSLCLSLPNTRTLASSLSHSHTQACVPRNLSCLPSCCSDASMTTTGRRATCAATCAMPIPICHHTHESGPPYVSQAHGYDTCTVRARHTRASHGGDPTAHATLSLSLYVCVCPRKCGTWPAPTTPSRCTPCAAADAIIFRSRDICLAEHSVGRSRSVTMVVQWKGS